MLGRVRLRHHASMRVSEEQNSLEAEMTAELLHIGDVIVDLIRAPVGRRV